ncbi:MAG TPA: hypothetical protein VF644_01280 [Pyrinomonadaceae bacterium]|jgi:preprotein translocase subunit SecG
MFNKLRSKLGLRQTSSVQEYGWLLFDHLKCDYLLIESKITDSQDKKNTTEIIDKRNNRQLVWEDIRAFDMIVLKYQDFETIKGKLMGLRKRFDGILSQAELEQYKASPKIDLATVAPAQIEELRAEYSSLAREFYIRYSYMASREGLRSLLLRSGAVLTIVFCLLMIVIAVIIFQNSTDGTIGFQNQTSSAAGDGGISKWLKYLSSFATLLMVVFAGITGAFVSMQQRIQSVSYKGDPIADLSVLTHGWLGIFLSPLSGAIFAVILYLFFAGQILTGTIFPEFIGSPENASLEITANAKNVTVQTPETQTTVDLQNSQANPVNANLNSQVNVNGNSNINPVNANQTNTNQAAQANSTPSSNSNPAITDGAIPASDTPNNVKSQPVPIHLVDFLITTGPKAGKDFAMLLIWCFIAGFAERFVPDALNRLVSRQSEAENKNT